MDARVPRFVGDEQALRAFRTRLKLTACPHCGKTGALIAHGSLTGYAEQGSDRVRRGQRFFCSNRYRRSGCGRTFSTLLAECLPRSTVTAGTLWDFAGRVVAGISRMTAWAATGFALSSGYRLWRRLQLGQSRLRTLLCTEGSPPPSEHASPLAQLLAHFGAALPGAECPFAAFQRHFQQPLLT